MSSANDNGIGLGLDGLGDLSSLLNPTAQVGSASGPLELSLDLIEEDLNQPRLEDNPGFKPELIAEIGETIKERGVKQPISVRDNPEKPGHYIINDGARRYRASKWAGKETIPAFVDNDFVPDDQVIANIQREGHTPREIARLIEMRIASGMSKGEIAKRWGKSPSYITQHANLLKLPPQIAAQFDSGRVTDVTVISELVTAFKKNPDEVAAWLEDDSQELTRGSVKLMREYIEDKKHQRDPSTIDAFTGKTDGEESNNESTDLEPQPKKKKQKSDPDPEKLKKAIVMVKHDERMGRLITSRRPSADGWAWIKYDDDGHEFEADLGTVQLMAVMEA
ncbi:ParB/RepB/Spo0J family partition protein [Aeromonas veronii]|uniref:ParB/RepB/Spo0J family partition protein n=1 Tax=Aeromonas veronii TaxID=654 RepID=UPI001302A82F|nr:ParB/RepB/Spo0J family partition protein [Aeromonas veronii]KAE9622545.1 ParB/RepB/Spo0J family partition protein [Aeromonas veronii]